MDYSNVLDLVLKKEPFDLMQAGIKPLEFRKPSQWIASRLVCKKYSHVKFRHGYAPDAPYFIAEYVGYVISNRAFYVHYEGGFVVFVEAGDYIIVFGKIVERGNIISNG